MFQEKAREEKITWKAEIKAQSKEAKRGTGWKVHQGAIGAWGSSEENLN